jgi:hypothetical protein
MQVLAMVISMYLYRMAARRWPRAVDRLDTAFWVALLVLVSA